MVTHTSDSFEIIQGYAVQLIRDGLAYMDNTDQETMQAERLERKESKCRNASVEDNLRIFERLCAGDKDYLDYCLRYVILSFSLVAITLGVLVIVPRLTCSR